MVRVTGSPQSSAGRAASAYLRDTARGHRLFEPTVDQLSGFFHRKAVAGNTWICHHPEKSSDRLPWQVDRRSAGHYLLRPTPRLRMQRRGTVIGIEKVARCDHERLSALLFRRHQTQPQKVVDGRLERTAGTMDLLVQEFADIIIQGESGPHIMMLPEKHHGALTKIR